MAVEKVMRWSFFCNIIYHRHDDSGPGNNNSPPHRSSSAEADNARRNRRQRASSAHISREGNKFKACSMEMAPSLAPTLRLPVIVIIVM